ncbi:uncharacterized protein LOC143247257 isoform X2 [Tachypleus tridentatus]|uniref:uncharacterized protein LOC143247257 isoform X2 n=1 Tax=Tachypleus tridentatus TaxID=6853 RepID=UPI003FD2358E
MVYCVANWLSKRFGIGQKLLFVSVQGEGTGRWRQWVRMVNRKNWTSHHAKLCQDHFERSCFVSDPTVLDSMGFKPGRLRLKKPSAVDRIVPIIFPRVELRTDFSLQRTGSTPSEAITKRTNLKSPRAEIDMGNKSSSPGGHHETGASAEKYSPVKSRFPKKSRSLDLGDSPSGEERQNVQLPAKVKAGERYTLSPITVSLSSPETLDEKENHVGSSEKCQLQPTSSGRSFRTMDQNDPSVEDPDVHWSSDNSGYSQYRTLTFQSSLDCDEPNLVREKTIEQRRFAIQELVDTEKDYVNDVGSIVEGYIALMKSGEVPMPEDLKNGRDKIVFGNIEAIYEWHRDFFLGELEKCIDEPWRLGSLFRRYERRLNMYIVFCQNKPKSEYVVSEYGDTYFEDILKCTEKAGLEEEIGDLRKAVQIMQVVPKTANDMMKVGRLQGFQGKITAQGKLLRQGKLMVSDPSCNGKLKERQVFLFEQIIIFSEPEGKTTQFYHPVYFYKNHLMVNKMSLGEKADNGDPLSFTLKSKDFNQKGLCLTIQCHTQTERDEWVESLRSILDTQLNFMRALQSPIAYQKGLTKDGSASYNNSLRKTFSNPASYYATPELGNPNTGSSLITHSFRETKREKNVRASHVKSQNIVRRSRCERIDSGRSFDGSDKSSEHFALPEDTNQGSSFSGLQSQCDASRLKE